MRICATPGCPTPTGGRHCATHTRQRDHTRGTRHERGYTAAHVRVRGVWARRVAHGTVHCARCGHPIVPGEPWHLDHTDDRTGYLGPSHAHCNLAAAGRAAHT